MTTPTSPAPDHADHADHDIHTPHAIPADAPRAYDTVVVGGGTAGLSAALLLGRACRRVLVIDAGTPRNRFAPHMHGVLGLDGTPPLDLLARGREELDAYGVEVVSGDVVSVAEVTRGLAVHRADGTIVHTRSLLVATGLQDVLPELEGLDALWGGGAFGCPYCHGWEVRGRRLGVLATSPMSAHQALLARQWSEDLTVFLAAGEELPREARGRLAARDVRFVEDPAVAAESADGRLTGIRTADGTLHPLDALLVSPGMRPRDGFLADLAPARMDTPVGSFLQVDGTGRTSHPRIWAAGNVTDPRLNVPGTAGQASMVAGAVNAALVEEDGDLALFGATAWPDLAEDGFWEDVYSRTARRWTGRPNAALVEALTDLSAASDGAVIDRGTAVDIGCGEGADAIWLALHGWDTTGVDVSATAIARAEEDALAAQVPAGRLRLTSEGLRGLPTDARFDLVTTSYLHAPSQDLRENLLRDASRLVAEGGRFFVLSHVLPAVDAETAAPSITDVEAVAQLGLDPAAWVVDARGEHRSAVIVPTGQVVERLDRSLLLRRA